MTRLDTRAAELGYLCAGPGLGVGECDKLRPPGLMDRGGTRDGGGG